MRKIDSLFNVPLTGLVFVSIGSAQLGAVIARYLFTIFSPLNYMFQDPPDLPLGLVSRSAW